MGPFRELACSAESPRRRTPEGTCAVRKRQWRQSAGRRKTPGKEEDGIPIYGDAPGGCKNGCPDLSSKQPFLLFSGHPGKATRL